MHQNIRNFRAFCKRVQILRGPEFDDQEIGILPDSVFGFFTNARVLDVLKIVRHCPEYHIVSCISPKLHVNGFVANALLYYLGEGDSDVTLIHDPFEKLDLQLLGSLNSMKMRRTW